MIVRKFLNSIAISLKMITSFIAVDANSKIGWSLFLNGIYYSTQVEGVLKHADYLLA